MYVAWNHLLVVAVQSCRLQLQQECMTTFMANIWDFVSISQINHMPNHKITIALSNNIKFHVDQNNKNQFTHLCRLGERLQGSVVTTPIHVRVAQALPHVAAG